jgi:hypothetical protein
VYSNSFIKAITSLSKKQLSPEQEWNLVSLKLNSVFYSVFCEIEVSCNVKDWVGGRKIEFHLIETLEQKFLCKSNQLLESPLFQLIEILKINLTTWSKRKKERKNDSINWKIGHSINWPKRRSANRIFWSAEKWHKKSFYQVKNTTFEKLTFDLLAFSQKIYFIQLKPLSFTIATLPL